MISFAKRDSKVEKVLQGLEEYLAENDMTLEIIAGFIYVNFDDETYKIVDRNSLHPVEELPRLFDEEVLLKS